MERANMWNCYCANQLKEVEEIGSMGSASMHSRFFENAVEDLTELCQEEGKGIVLNKFTGSRGTVKRTSTKLTEFTKHF